MQSCKQELILKNAGGQLESPEANIYLFVI